MLVQSVDRKLADIKIRILSGDNMKYIIDIDALKACLNLINKPYCINNKDCVYLATVLELIEEFPKDEFDSQKNNLNNEVEESVKRGRWVYWGGWCGNHDMRIEDAVCSECGYKHPTVRFEQGDPRGAEAYEAVLNKLSDECPKCGALMQKE